MDYHGLCNGDMNALLDHKHDDLSSSVSCFLSFWICQFTTENEYLPFRLGLPTAITKWQRTISTVSSVYLVTLLEMNGWKLSAICSCLLSTACTHLNAFLSPWFVSESWSVATVCWVDQDWWLMLNRWRADKNDGSKQQLFMATCACELSFPGLAFRHWPLRVTYWPVFPYSCLRLGELYFDCIPVSNNIRALKKLSINVLYLKKLFVCLFSHGSTVLGSCYVCWSWCGFCLDRLSFAILFLNFCWSYCT